MYNLYLSYKKPNFQMTAETPFVDHSYSLLLLPLTSEMTPFERLEDFSNIFTTHCFI